MSIVLDQYSDEAEPDFARRGFQAPVRSNVDPVAGIIAALVISLFLWGLLFLAGSAVFAWLTS